VFGIDSSPLESQVQSKVMFHFEVECGLAVVDVREKIDVQEDKPFITFWGPGGADSTILIWYDTANSAGSTYKSASTSVKSEGFIATGITFKVLY
jgi:hypothetical protein